MKIDIVSYTDEQYAAMTHTQIDEVRQAQKNKDKLTLKLRENLHKEKYALVKLFDGSGRVGIGRALRGQLRTEF